MTHSMFIFCVIRSATALSVIAAVNIRRDTRTAKRLGQEISRPSLKPITLCNMNHRTFARLHSVRMLAIPTDMSVPGERFFFDPMQLMTAFTPSRAPVRPPGERTSPRTKDWRATAVMKCPCASTCFTTLRRAAPVAPTTAIFITPPVGTHHDDSDRERHSSLVLRQVSGRRLDASRSVEKMHREFLRAVSAAARAKVSHMGQY
jgi:hypothetical protein